MLVVADVQQDRVMDIVTRFGAEAVAPEQIHAQDVDVFAPCAMGAILNDSSIPEIKAKVICGLANNQLAHKRHGQMLAQRGIAYVPDYVVNAGGMIGASTVIHSVSDHVRPDRAQAEQKILGLYDSITSILVQANDTKGASTSDIADGMARRIISDARST